MFLIGLVSFLIALPFLIVPTSKPLPSVGYYFHGPDGPWTQVPTCMRLTDSPETASLGQAGNPAVILAEHSPKVALRRIGYGG